MFQREGNRVPNQTIALPSGHKVSLRDFKNMDQPKRVMKDDAAAVPAASSMAGTSSRFLPNYLKHRAKEKRRIASMEAEGQLEEERALFDKQREERARAFEEEAAKKRDRRKKRKAQGTSDSVIAAHVSPNEHGDIPHPKFDEAQPVRLPQSERAISTIQILDEE